MADYEPSITADVSKLSLHAYVSGSELRISLNHNDRSTGRMVVITDTVVPLKDIIRGVIEAGPV